MQPIALLMMEHRLIERMLPLIHKEARTILEARKVDLDFLESGRTMSYEKYQSVVDQYEL